ncbi:MAG: LacI family DNA-binding transcriptional regulator [Pleomorphochaeta sp.]
MSDAVTIFDVAKKAGVAPATVSHALNGKRPVSKKTKDVIQQAIDELGYVPSWNASKLKSSGSGIIGCLAIDITESFVNKIVKGIEKGISGGQYSLLYVSALEFDGDFQKAYNFLKSHNVDGTLFCHHIPRPLNNNIGDLKFNSPLVSVNTVIDKVPSIVVDNKTGGLQAAEHLISCGVKNPAIIGGPKDRLSAINRLVGFKKRLNELNILLNERKICFGEYEADHGYEAAKKILSFDKSVDGIFCENDYIAAGAINAILDLGLSVPNDVKVLGFDNRDFSKFWRPSISTFDIPLEEMGLLGAYKLKEIINNNSSSNDEIIAMQSKIIPRKSTLMI